MAEEKVLTRQELFDLVWSKPMKVLATEFKLSDVGLAKTCKRYDIPRPERGYWAKLAVGKAPKKPSLQGDPALKIRFFIADEPVPQPEPVISPEVTEWIDRELDAKHTIVVLESVHRYHPLVRPAKDALEKKSDSYGPDDGWRWSGHEAVSIRVTKPLVGRACRLMHAMFTAFDERKWRISHSREQRESVVSALGAEFKISLAERQKRIAHTPTAEDLARQKRGWGPPGKYDNVPSGRLRLNFEHGWHKLEFEDTDTKLEQRLNEVVLSLARKVLEVIRPQEEQRARDEEKRREEEHQRWLFREKCDRFDAAYQAWTEQQQRLHFVSVLEEAVAKLDDPSERMREFVAWTRRYVEWADPLAKFFEGIEHDKNVYFHEFTRKSFR